MKHDDDPLLPCKILAMDICSANFPSLLQKDSRTSDLQPMK